MIAKRKKTPKTEIFEFQIWQGGIMVASAIGLERDATREGMHYAAMYLQDGPVEVIKKRVRATAQDRP